MKIVLAPDSFKGSLSAADVCEAMERGIRKVLPDVNIVHAPMADGGEGTVEALVSSTGGHLETVRVTDPLGHPVEAFYGILGDGETAVIEMAAASGLPLVPEEKRNPLFTTTYGTGELIKAAAEKGCRKFIIGIGGSATTDCGTGMAQALGVRFYNVEDTEITACMSGGLLADVVRIDLSRILPAINESRFTVACDVDNPLLGPQGCSYVYGPQKGATPEIVVKLEANMTGFADVLEQAIGKPVRDIPGAGAAGGLGAGLIAFTGAQLKPGIDIVLEASDFAEKIQDAALILTGEGRIDFQTAFGKTLSGVGREAQKAGIPVVGLGGMVDHDIDNLYEIGLTAFFSICNQPMSLEKAMTDAAQLIEVVTERIIRTAHIPLA